MNITAHELAQVDADRKWSDRFIPEIKSIVGPHLLTTTPAEIDRTQAADLMVFTAGNVRIAARVRRHGYADRYRYEFTIRSRRDSGSETEFSKIMDGWGDWFFYGHADAAEQKLALWWLLDLAVFRAAVSSGHSLRCGDQTNGDGTHFRWFGIRSFPPKPPLVIASGGLSP